MKSQRKTRFLSANQWIGASEMVETSNSVQLPKDWLSHARRILHPLLITATVIGASVHHSVKLVMIVKWTYFLIVNVFILLGSGVCVYDIMNIIVCVAHGW
jgi:hypothetical protein